MRTESAPLESVSYRFSSASAAVNASDAVAPCTRLHLRPFRFRVRALHATRHGLHTQLLRGRTYIG